MRPSTPCATEVSKQWSMPKDTSPPRETNATLPAEELPQPPRASEEPDQSPREQHDLPIKPPLTTRSGTQIKPNKLSDFVYEMRRC